MSNSPATAPQRNVHLAWHHFRFQVPETWEVVQYKKNPDEGQLGLSDRHGQTMQVFWRRTPEETAVQKRLIDLATANYEEQFSEREIRRHIETQAGWRAFLPRKEGMAVFAGRFLKKDRILLSLVFPPHPVTDNHNAAQHIIRTFKSNNDTERAWAAFGLDLSLPESWRLAEVDPLPAMQRLVFESTREETISVYRFGMVPVILKGEDLPTFFARIKGRRYRMLKTGEFEKDGCPGVSLSYETRGKTGGLMSLLARTWQGRVWIWRCDRIKRIFAVDQHARPDRLIDQLQERLRCR